jgi:hypothetical protein
LGRIRRRGKEGEEKIGLESRIGSGAVQFCRHRVCWRILVGEEGGGGELFCTNRRKAEKRGNVKKKLLLLLLPRKSERETRSFLFYVLYFFLSHRLTDFAAVCLLKITRLPVLSRRKSRRDGG